MMCGFLVAKLQNPTKSTHNNKNWALSNQLLGKSQK